MLVALKICIVFLSSDGGYTWTEHLSGEQVFSGLEDCGDGVYLVGTYAYGKTAITVKTRARKNGIATVITARAHGLTSGGTAAIYTMGDSTFDVRPYTTVTVINTTAFEYASPGDDVAPTSDGSGKGLSLNGFVSKIFS